MHDDGLAYVKEAEWPDIYNGEKDTEPVYQGARGLAAVPEPLLENVIESADVCPGECIYLEMTEE